MLRLSEDGDRAHRSHRYQDGCYCIELDIRNDKSLRCLVKPLDQQAATQREVGTQGRTEYLDIERLVLDKLVASVLGYRLTHHLIPRKQEDASAAAGVSSPSRLNISGNNSDKERTFRLNIFLCFAGFSTILREPSLCFHLLHGISCNCRHYRAGCGRDGRDWYR